MPRECGHFSDTRLRVNGRPVFEHATELFQKLSPSKWSNVKIRQGDSVELLLSGGGGWGSPFERDPRAVLDDVLNHFVSIEGARNHYGVVIDEERLVIDDEATRMLRQDMVVRGPKIEHAARVEVLQTVLFRGSTAEKLGSDESRLHSVLSTHETTTGILVRLQGSSYDELSRDVRYLWEKLGAEPLVLTTQFVPSGFKGP